MSTIVADATLPAKLAALTEPTEIVNEEGRKLGRYIPEPFCPWDPNLTPQEADRIADEPDGCSLEEIWKRLGVR